MTTFLIGAAFSIISGLTLACAISLIKDLRRP